MGRDMEGTPAFLSGFHTRPPRDRLSTSGKKCDISSDRTVETEASTSSSLDDDGTSCSTSSFSSSRSNRSMISPQGRRRSSMVLERRRSARRLLNNSTEDCKAPIASPTFRKKLIQRNFETDREKIPRSNKENTNELGQSRQSSFLRLPKSPRRSGMKRATDGEVSSTGRKASPQTRKGQEKQNSAEDIFDFIPTPGVSCSKADKDIVVRRHSDTDRLCEMRASVTQQRNQLRDMLGNTKIKAAVGDGSLELVQQQQQQIKELAERCRKLEESTTQVSAQVVKDKQVLELQARLSQLEINRAWGELQLRNKITRDAQEHEKALKSAKREAAAWKSRFEELWARSQEAAEVSKLQSHGTIQANLLMGAMNKNPSESVLTKPTSSTPYATGEDQANLLNDSMNKNKRSRLRLRSRANNKTLERSPDAMLLERLKAENELLRLELSNRPSQ